MRRKITPAISGVISGCGVFSSNTVRDGTRGGADQSESTSFLSAFFCAVTLASAELATRPVLHSNETKQASVKRGCGGDERDRGIAAARPRGGTLSQCMNRPIVAICHPGHRRHRRGSRDRRSKARSAGPVAAVPWTWHLSNPEEELPDDFAILPPHLHTSNTLMGKSNEKLQVAHWLCYLLRIWPDAGPLARTGSSCGAVRRYRQTGSQLLLVHKWPDHGWADRERQDKSGSRHPCP